MRIEVNKLDIETELERSGHASTPDNVKAVADALHDIRPLLKMVVAGLELPNKFAATPMF